MAGRTAARGATIAEPVEVLTDPRWLALLAAGGLVLVLGTLAAARRWRSVLAGRRSRRGLRAEGRAVRVLRRHGYTIEATQVTGRWTYTVDGASVEVTCRADLIVRRGRERRVAEVKSGRSHADPTNPHTRRQLLEYVHAFDVDGALLVDMVREQVHRIDFDGGQSVG